MTDINPVYYPLMMLFVLGILALAYGAGRAFAKGRFDQTKKEFLKEQNEDEG